MLKNKIFKNIGIVGFGAYVPYFRIKVEEIARVWQKDAENIKNYLGIEQKTVADIDEDSLTMAVEASLRALRMAGIKPSRIGAVFVGSESHPYAVKPTGTILAEILNIGRDYFCADLQFACKAGTAGLQIILAMIDSGLVDYGLVVGSDKAQAKAGGALEFTAGAGAAAFVLGRKRMLAEVKSTYSFSSDMPDFWRRQNCSYPEHAGRFTGEPGYFYHLISATKNFLKKTGFKISDFNHVVFHMPNAKFPLKAAKSLGVEKKQLEKGFLVSQIGNPYSASSLLGLTAVLSQAKNKDKVLLVSYGSGAGSDCFVLEIKKTLEKQKTDLDKIINNYQSISYPQYLQKMEILQ